MSNLHANLDEANKHTPKGFDNAATNTRPWKDESNQSTYTENETLPRALNFVDGTTAPPTTTNGHIYVITGTGTLNAGWGSASFNDWVRFANGFPVSISPVTGYLCYDITASQWMEFDGTTWAAFGGGGVVSTIFTGGTMSAPSTIAMGGNDLTFSGGKTTFKGSGSTSATTALLVENSLGIDLLEVKDDGTILGNLPNIYTSDGTTTGDRLITMPQNKHLALYSAGSNSDYIQFRSPYSSSSRSGGFGHTSTDNLYWRGVNRSIYIHAGSVSKAQLEIVNSNELVSVRSKLAIYTNSEVIDSYLNSNGESFVSLISGNNFGVGINGAVAKLHVKGSGSTPATTALLVQNSLGTDLLEVKDDGDAFIKRNLNVVQGTVITDGLFKVSARNSGGANSPHLQGYYDFTGNSGLLYQFINGPSGASTKQAKLNIYSSNTVSCRISAISNEGSFLNYGLTVGTNSQYAGAGQIVAFNNTGGELLTKNASGVINRLYSGPSGSSTNMAIFDQLHAGNSTVYNRLTTIGADENFLSNNTGIGFNSTTSAGINAKLHVNGSTLLDGNLGLFGTTPIAQPTTAVAASILGTASGISLTDLDTFDGYTLQQVVRALRNLGILA